MKEIKRGEIYYANLQPVLGSEQGGVRPVVILQNDKGNLFSPTTIVDEIAELKEKQLEARRRKKLVESYDERIKEMDEFLQNTSQALPEFDNDLVRRLINNIKVISADEITIQFKSGIVMNQKLNEEW